MKTYKSNWWSIILPDVWETEEDEACATFAPQSRDCALQMSAARNSNGLATDDDLRDFASDHIEAGAPIKPIICGEFSGFYLHYSDDDTYQREWWLRCHDTVVLVSYGCDIGDKGKNNDIVNSIIESLHREE